jgi:hypothetical protein
MKNIYFVELMLAVSQRFVQNCPYCISGRELTAEYSM